MTLSSENYINLLSNIVGFALCMTLVSSSEQDKMKSTSKNYKNLITYKKICIARDQDFREVSPALFKRFNGYRKIGQHHVYLNNKDKYLLFLEQFLTEKITSDDFFNGILSLQIESKTELINLENNLLNDPSLILQPFSSRLYNNINRLHMECQNFKTKVISLNNIDPDRKILETRFKTKIHQIWQKIQ